MVIRMCWTQPKIEHYLILVSSLQKSTDMAVWGGRCRLKRRIIIKEGIELLSSNL